ncbi:GAF domain-containing protein [Nocardia macrotermitis]|uniref:Rv3651-like N-terminal domain-containing protein n=1 Tax=Nocardia macrotermitis TaxID=2585198 RepID=A0A7K0CZN8_9NOCA|nr:GAF domain-containing protein [Nocardia macrotermitis]MQY18946.1 hypothetical protein [Nocardia macrotermitis]
MSWFLIESLAPSSGPMTIILRDGAPRDWTSLRSLHRHEFVDVDEQLQSVRENKTRIQTIVRARGGRTRLIEIDPVLGPEGDTYGMHLWIGPDADEPIAHRPASAISWHLGDTTVRMTEDLWRMTLTPCDTNTPTPNTLSAAEFFRKLVRFDALAGLAELATSPDPAATWSGFSVVLHDDGHLMNWYNVGRGRLDQQQTGVRGLAVDVTDTTPPSISAIDAVTSNTRPNARNAQLADPEAPITALLAWTPDLPMPVLAHWISHAPSWIDWEREGDPSTFHPDDTDTILATYTRLAGTDDTITVDVRIRGFTASGWQPITITSRRYPGDVGDTLHIIHITKQDR